MTDPIADLIGDYRAFTALQRGRLAARGIDISPYELSHLAVRVPEWDQYVHLRNLLERHAVANVENVWNGRPISMILLAEPLRVLDGQVLRPPARALDGAARLLQRIEEVEADERITVVGRVGRATVPSLAPDLGDAAGNLHRRLQTHA